MIKKTLFLFFLFFPYLVQGQLKLNISIILKKGVDQGLILVNELHSAEFVKTKKMIKLRMRNGISVFLKAEYVEGADDYGPSGKIKLTGRVLDGNENLIKSFKDENIIIPMGDSRKIICEGSNHQIVEVTIRPELY